MTLALVAATSEACINDCESEDADRGDGDGAGGTDGVESEGVEATSDPTLLENAASPQSSSSPSRESEFCTGCCTGCC